MLQYKTCTMYIIYDACNWKYNGSLMFSIFVYHEQLSYTLLTNCFCLFIN